MLKSVLVPQFFHYLVSFPIIDAIFVLWKKRHDISNQGV
ncbi:hypothetical protein ADICYQ_3051 [Cyclobacterium qasimii M12-11B]|uniref:Uncharacterized protein n=1 Tax=Cyclobacterium qasimii M12-11B TaxID=641524 RepID=S7WMM3_9BACT|nr:hypothetical protein ADICYQ_3051 [Cyclobacterium qasimii M12-11B]